MENLYTVWRVIFKSEQILRLEYNRKSKQGKGGKWRKERGQQVGTPNFMNLTPLPYQSKTNEGRDGIKFRVKGD